ncbi:MAG: hypothetical protein HYY06_07775 [Deltaproteobacteria bacterium]|nr:hypothetical protein [Deltaproteobacteria bacterium]
MPLVAAVVVSAPDAHAIPRFAIRTGLPCSSCHESPTGGGMRTAFARNVFVPRWLAMGTGPAEPDVTGAVEIGERVAIGTDLRAGYLYQNSPRAELADTSSWTLMQADLYLNVDVSRHLGFYLDTGAYGGFEAWAAMRPYGRPDHRDLLIRAGRFVIPFGLREPNHGAWIREGIGLGPTDRDNALEIALANGRTTAQLAISNGTYGDSFLDANGTGAERRPYEMAVSARLTWQPRIGPLRLLIAASGMANRNASTQNPIFVPALFAGSESATIGQGVNEQRVGLALGAALGRLGYRGEIVGVHDRLRGGDHRSLAGYVSYQELSLTIVRGLDLAATYEFADSDIEFRRGRVDRLGGIVEFVPIPGLELWATVRHSFGDDPDYLIGGSRDDVVVFAHLFL